MDNIKSDKGSKQVRAIDYTSPGSYNWYSRTGNSRHRHCFYPHVVAVHKHLGTGISGEIVSMIVKKFLVYTLDYAWKDFGPGTLGGTVWDQYGSYFRIVVKFTNGMIIDGSYGTPDRDHHINLHGDFTFGEPHFPAPNELNGVPE